MNWTTLFHLFSSPSQSEFPFYLLIWFYYLLISLPNLHSFNIDFFDQRSGSSLFVESWVKQWTIRLQGCRRFTKYWRHFYQFQRITSVGYGSELLFCVFACRVCTKILFFLSCWAAGGKQYFGGWTVILCPWFYFKIWFFSMILLIGFFIMIWFLFLFWSGWASSEK